jgi:Cation transporter/ATPase, N-terminus
MESNVDSSKLQESSPGSKPKLASAADVSPQNGLTSDEARRRLEKFGAKAMPDTALHPLWMASNTTGVSILAFEAEGNDRIS